MRFLLLATLLAWTLPAWAGFDLHDLWRTPNQQAQTLLDHGHPAEAAKLFSDPRRKAYAELQAGNYAQAAKGFTAFDDSDDQYNRGNALARAGRLQAAIKAYDAALAHDPHNRDARHNRDLVEQALKRQQQPKQNRKSGAKQNGKGGNSRSNDDKGGQGQQNRQSGSQDKNQSQAHAENQQAKDRQGADKGNQNGRGTQGRNQGDQTGSQSRQDKSAGQGQATGAEPTKPGQAAEYGAQARQDAQAALNEAGSDRAGSAIDAPISEKQLSREQWLRQIPDDPGGLLRRKFLIEHMLRQQGRQP